MTDTITALQERIEESKMPDIDILDTILQNQLVYMSAQIEILNKLDEVSRNFISGVPISENIATQLGENPFKENTP